MPNPTNPISACCQAYMTTQDDIEGTSHYVCDNCHEPCDQYVATNPNEAEDAERRMLENELLGVVSQLSFLERGKTLSSSMYPELTDFILADRQAQRQKWVEDKTHTRDIAYKSGYASGFKTGQANVRLTHPKMMQSAREEWLKEVEGRMSERPSKYVRMNSDCLEGYNIADAAWRAALRGESKHE